MSTHPSEPIVVDPSDLVVPAETWERVLARLIDHVLVSIASAVVIAPLGFAAAIAPGPAGWLVSAVSALLSAGMCVAYFVALESRKGQTIGKRVLGLRVVNDRGGIPTWNQAGRRNLWTGLGALGVVPIIGAYVGSLATVGAALVILLTVKADKTYRRGWHDAWAGGTQVVRDK